MTTQQHSERSLTRRNFVKAGALACATGLFALNGCTLEEVKNSQLASEFQGIENKQYGLAINVSMLDALGGQEFIDSIIAACHSYHNVPKIDDPKKSMDWIWTQSYEEAFSDIASTYVDEKTASYAYPVMCNHCTDPQCVRVCPTQTTFKRPDGIVMMDYHRCIGCRFCMSACPYGARSFNFMDPRPYVDKESMNPGYPTRSKGVVEKCTLCYELIDQGSVPVCVQAAYGCITFGDLTDENSEIRQVLSQAFSIRRRVELGTGPNVYYIFDEETASLYANGLNLGGAHGFEGDLLEGGE